MTKVAPYYLRPNAYQEELNRLLIQLIPELDGSELAQTPMKLNRWYKPSEKLDNGEPCYIEAVEPGPPRPNYIWMPQRKDLPAGYYHLRTQEAYIQVYWLLEQNAPKRGFLLRRKSNERKLYERLRDIIYNRVVYDEPDDVYAARLKALGFEKNGDRAKRFARAAYLPALTSALLLSLATF